MFFQLQKSILVLNSLFYIRNALPKLHRSSSKFFPPLPKTCVPFYLFSEIFLVQSRRFNIVVCFLACSIPLITSLEFTEFVKQNSQY